MEVYFFKQTVLLFAIKLILCSLFTFLICKLHPPVPWLLSIGKTAPLCFQFEYSLPYLDDPNLSPLTGLSRQPWVTGRVQPGGQHRPCVAEWARAACLAPLQAFFPPTIIFFSNKVWEESQLQQEGLEILGSTPCSQKVLVGRQRTSDTQRNKDERFRGWHWADTTWKMTWLFCWKRLEGEGLQKEERSLGMVKGKIESVLTWSGFLKRMGKKWAWCQKRQRELGRFHIEGREEGKWGRRAKLTKN